MQVDFRQITNGVRAAIPCFSETVPKFVGTNERYVDAMHGYLETFRGAPNVPVAAPAHETLTRAYHVNERAGAPLENTFVTLTPWLYFYGNRTGFGSFKDEVFDRLSPAELIELARIKIAFPQWLQFKLDRDYVQNPTQGIVSAADKSGWDLESRFFEQLFVSYLLCSVAQDLLTIAEEKMLSREISVATSSDNGALDEALRALHDVLGAIDDIERTPPGIETFISVSSLETPGGQPKQSLRDLVFGSVSALSDHIRAVEGTDRDKEKVEADLLEGAKRAAQDVFHRLYNAYGELADILDHYKQHLGIQGSVEEFRARPGLVRLRTKDLIALAKVYLALSKSKQFFMLVPPEQYDIRQIQTTLFTLNKDCAFTHPVLDTLRQRTNLTSN